MISVKSIDNKRNKYPIRLHINSTAISLSISTAKRLVDEFCDAILCSESGSAKSDNSEAVEQPLTQQGSEPSEICPDCVDGWQCCKGGVWKCKTCGGSGKLLPC